MGFFDTVLGGATLGLGEKLLDNFTSAKAATKSFDREKWMMSNRYQLQVKDMIAAGINPMLAAGASPPSPSAPMAQMSKGGISNSIQAVNSASMAKAQIAALEAEANWKNVMAVTEANRPQNVQSSTEQNLTSAERNRAETVNLKASLDKIGAEINNIKADIAKKGAETVTIEVMRDLNARLAKLEAQEKALRMPEAELRGKAAERVNRGTENTESLAEQAGHYLGGKAADLRDTLNEVYDKWQAGRKARGDKLRRERR